MPESRDTRPSPDALLKQVARGTRGRLKIFLGAAPGVGKTYEMLSSAQAKRRAGVDVVVGVVETHGRKETETLLDGLMVVPRALVEYKGRTLGEMDIDAVLARKPQIVLVDELAHTNAPGSRHPKRYLDVEEVLAAGIDVYTTLNIQHVESLNDVIAKITHIRVRETVPDSIIDLADDVELVDLTPEDLIQRLKEGKIYVPEQAQRAVQNYFMPGNLTALRELALRRTAQRVDDQMVTYMRAHAIPGPWPAGERVLVCVNEHPSGIGLVRYTRRLADRLRASWTAVHVETSRSLRLSEPEKSRIAECLRLAEHLGAATVTLPAADVPGGVVDYAQSNNVTHIVIAKSNRSRWSELWRGSVTHQLIRRAGDISVHVIAEDTARRTGENAVDEVEAASTGLNLGHYGGTLGMVAAATAAGVAAQHVVAASNFALVFLTAVLGSAVTYGLWPSIFAAVASAVAYNYFFLPPLYSFTITDPENVLALFFFIVVAAVAGNLAARVRTQAINARQRARTTDELYTFSRKLAGAVVLDDLLWATAYQIASMLKARVVVLLPENGGIAVRAGYPPEDTLAAPDFAAATWAWQQGRPAGRGSDTLPGVSWLFLPMRTGRGLVGIVGLESDRPGPLLTPDRRRLLDALVDQAALAVERINLAKDIDQARLFAETERLRGALLTSISHDLRTPLASILGAATSLKNFRETLDDKAVGDLAGVIQDEAERLNRFIANLLDMTRLESGKITPKGELIDLADVVGSALERARKVVGERPVDIELARELPMLRLDPVLFEQVLFNLLDNAAKYSPAGTRIALSAGREGETVHLRVADEGDGIPEADLERIFDKFYRVHAADHRRAGTGLGLAICRGFIEAMGGTISASNRMDRPGATFTVTLPVPADEPFTAEAA
ncbi:MAG: sensor histidine kinase KdpD [Rhodospirillaceae bacterium]|nr:sensor histidine kinase KdpD [Rhodospirillaceae bacterium]